MQTRKPQAGDSIPGSERREDGAGSTGEKSGRRPEEKPAVPGYE